MAIAITYIQAIRKELTERLGDGQLGTAQTISSYNLTILLIWLELL